MWDPQWPVMCDAGYRVVRCDFRGFGDTPVADRPYGDAADVAALLDRLGLERVAPGRVLPRRGGRPGGGGDQARGRHGPGAAVLGDARPCAGSRAAVVPRAQETHCWRRATSPERSS
ncbi:hypothetical protein AB0D09_26905 [Streptomyces sp. NPDC049097]|uniref:alpha/beta fold hydrolase n=1 Tax=Streptomyces sp. NPDC049097 TaxID=3155497 RepID=UPI0034401680